MNKNKEVLSAEITFVRKSGEKFPALYTTYPIIDDDSVVGTIEVSIDISDLKRAQEDFRKSQKQFLQFMENIPAAIFIKDNKLRTLFVNRYMREVMGADDDWIGKTSFELFKKEKAEIVNEDDKQALKLGRFDREEKFLSKDNNELIFYTQKFRINIDKNTDLLGGISTDITNQRKAESNLNEYKNSLEKIVKQRTNELNKKTKSLENNTVALSNLVDDMNQVQKELEESNVNLNAVNKELETFSYTVSHDISAPLRSMKRLSEIIMDDYSEQIDEEGKEIIELINDSAGKLQQLINDILNLSRIGSKTLNIEKLDMSNMVEKIISQYKSYEPDRKVNVKIQEDMEIMADYNMLKMMLKNLIENSFKYTKYKKNAKVEIGINSTENKITKKGNEFFIKDNGVGFNNKYAEKVFNPFTRMHGEDEFPGTGIGLASVQRIVNKHGGTIRAVAKVDKGATFYFTL